VLGKPRIRVKQLQFEGLVSQKWGCERGETREWQLQGEQEVAQKKRVEKEGAWNM